MIIQTRLLYIVALNSGTRQLRSTQLLPFHCCTKARFVGLCIVYLLVCYRIVADFADYRRIEL